jgi:hypothetical protein
MRLWEYDEFGEPWLENGTHNPPLIIINKKGKRKMARSKYARRKSRSRGRKASNPRRRKTSRRRNAWPMAGTVVSMNPRRKSRRGRKRSNPRRKRHSYRRNSAVLGIALPPMQSVIYAGVGFVAPPMLEGFLSRMLPVSLTANKLGKYAIRIASVLGVSYLTKMIIGSSEAKMVAIGGGAYVLTSAVSEFAPGMIPGLSSYSRPTSALSAYTPSSGRTFNQLGAPNWGARNTTASAPGGGANIVAARFRRFQ